MKFVITYLWLAFIATIANIGAQELAIRCFDGAHRVGWSVAFGTLVGLAIKYALDKRYIFGFRSRDAVHNGKTFILYALMGGITTGIFWGFEFTFDLAFQTRMMRYAGGVIGLTIGYLIKYQLDKRFVFNINQ